MPTGRDFADFYRKVVFDGITQVPRYSEHLVALCTAQADCITDETAVDVAELQQIQLPQNSVYVELELIVPNTSMIYNNGTNTYALFPRARGALVSIGAEDTYVAANRMNQAATTIGSSISDGSVDVVSLGPNKVYKKSWAAGSVDMLHVGFLDFVYLFNNTGTAGVIGDVVTGGTPIARYIGAKLAVRVGFDGEAS